MDWLSDVRLIDGPLHWGALVLGIAGAAYLILAPSKARLQRCIMLSLAAAAAAFALVATIHWALINVFAVFPDNVPDTVLLWVAAAVGGIILALLRLPGASWPGRGP